MVQMTDMLLAAFSIVCTLIIGVGIPIFLAWRDGLLRK